MTRGDDGLPSVGGAVGEDDGFASLRGVLEGIGDGDEAVIAMSSWEGFDDKRTDGGGDGEGVGEGLGVLEGQEEAGFVSVDDDDFVGGVIGEGGEGGYIEVYAGSSAKLGVFKDRAECTEEEDGVEDEPGKGQE